LTKISGQPTLEVFFLEGTQLLENFWNPVDGVDFLPHQLQYLIGGLEHDFYFSIYWEFHDPN